jgi:hypothetical protein
MALQVLRFCPVLQQHPAAGKTVIIVVNASAAAAAAKLLPASFAPAAVCGAIQ